MTRNLTTLFATAAILGGIAAATTVLAEETAPSPQSPHTQDTMGGHGGMLNMTGQMRPDQMKQMTRMVDNSNPMMESMNNAPAGFQDPRGPSHR